MGSLDTPCQPTSDGALQATFAADSVECLSLLEQDARTLAEAADRLVMAETGEALGEALAHNLALWVAIKTVVGAADNPLPAEVRHNLDRLAVYVIRTTLSVEQGRVTSAEIETMARINLNIAEGLNRGQRNRLIADRAYQLWEIQGRPEGRAFDNWLQAELEIEALLTAD